MERGKKKENRLIRKKKMGNSQKKNNLFQTDL